MSRLSELLNAQNKEPPWENYDFEKNSLVVIAYGDCGRGHDHGCVIWYVGGHIAMEIEEAGLTHLEDLGLEPPSPGIWVWEGKYVWGSSAWDYPQEGYMQPEGDFRKPTEEEWAAIRENRNPWNNEDWKLKSANGLSND